MRWSDRIAHLAAPRWLTRHFAGELGLRAERRMRRHLGRCPECRALYGAMMLCEGEGAAAARQRRARLGAALFGPVPTETTSAASFGLTRSSRSNSLAIATAGLAAVAALVLLVLVLGPPEPGFRRKGPTTATETDQDVGVTVYHRARTGRLERAKGVVFRKRGLAFAYNNEADVSFDGLLLFGVDEGQRVYWFYPGWSDPRTDPGPYPIRRGAGVELPDEVIHDYRGRQLRIFALFTRDRTLTVQSVEQMVQRLVARGTRVERLNRLPLEDTGQQSMLMKVEEP